MRKGHSAIRPFRQGSAGPDHCTEPKNIRHARRAALGVVNLLATVLIFGAISGLAPARSQPVSVQTDAGSQVVALLGGSSGAERYRILHNLNAANRISSGLTVADLNAIIVGMEDQRTKVISLMARKLQPTLSATDVVALSGDTRGSTRYNILHNLNAANRIAPGLTVADLNAIIVGMEDQRAKVISLMARKLQPNLSAADVVALSGDTRGSMRYTILHNLNAANRIASSLTVADLNAIIAGMEDQRAKVISLMARKLQPNLSAADVVASGAIGGAVPITASPPPPAEPPRPGVLGGCGSTKWQRLAVPEYVCFSSYGGTLPWVNICNIALTTGYSPVYFGEACRAHDICYGSAGARKSQCDQNFLALLRATCDETLVGQLWSLGRRNCHNASSEFYHQVSTNGCDAFVNAQSNAGTATPACD